MAETSPPLLPDLTRAKPGHCPRRPRRRRVFLPDLARAKSGRACLPPAGAFLAPAQAAAPRFPSVRSKPALPCPPACAFGQRTGRLSTGEALIRSARPTGSGRRGNGDSVKTHPGLTNSRLRGPSVQEKRIPPPQENSPPDSFQFRRRSVRTCDKSEVCGVPVLHRKPECCSAPVGGL